MDSGIESRWCRNGFAVDGVAIVVASSSCWRFLVARMSLSISISCRLKNGCLDIRLELKNLKSQALSGLEETISQVMLGLQPRRS